MKEKKQGQQPELSKGIMVVFFILIVFIVIFVLSGLGSGEVKYNDFMMFLATIFGGAGAAYFASYAASQIAYKGSIENAKLAGELAKEAAIEGAKKAAEINIAREEWGRFHKLHSDYTNSLGQLYAIYHDSIAASSERIIEKKDIEFMSQSFSTIYVYVDLKEEEEDFLQEVSTMLNNCLHDSVKNGEDFLRILSDYEELKRKIDYRSQLLKQTKEEGLEYSDDVIEKINDRIDYLWKKTDLDFNMICKAGWEKEE